MKKNLALVAGLAAAGAAVWWLLLRKGANASSVATNGSSSDGAVSATPQSLYANTAPLRAGTQGFTLVQPRAGQGGSANGGGLDSAIALGGNVNDLIGGFYQIGKDVVNGIGKGLGAVGSALGFINNKTGENFNTEANNRMFSAQAYVDAVNAEADFYDAMAAQPSQAWAYAPPSGGSDLAGRSFSVSDPIVDTPTDNVVWPAGYEDYLSYADSPYWY